MSHLLAVVLLLGVGLAFLPKPAGAEPVQDVPAAQPPRPAPGLTPARVIGVQLEALRIAGDPQADPDTGMATVFAFASPDNQAQTGPLERFDAMVRQPPYAVLVGHVRHHTVELRLLDAEGQPTDDPELITSVQALVAVEPADPEADAAWFVWVLSPQADGPHAGCWMTDLVAPVPPPPVADPPADLV